MADGSFVPMAARHRAQTAKRFATIASLKAGVRAYCLRYVRERGIEWDDRRQSYLEAAIDTSVSNDAVVLARKLRDVLTEIVEFVDDDQRRQKADPPAPFLRRFATDVAKPTLSRLDDQWLDRRKQEPRAILVANFAKGKLWWWGERSDEHPRENPSSRDLAVLSILAGNFPESASKANDLTVSTVLAAEERAVNYWRTKWDLAWRTRKRGG